MDEIGHDYLAKVKTKIGDFRPNGVYWCGSKHIGFDMDYRRRLGIPIGHGKSPTADTYPLDLIPKFKPGDPHLLIVRGGIGDLLALSVLHDVAPEITVITTRGLFPVLDWWKVPPKRVKGFNEPLFTVKYPKKIEEYCKQFSVQDGDEMIVAGSRENWYDIIYRSVGFSPEQINDLPRRPQLRLLTSTAAKRRLSEMSLLIVHKATSVNRTADLESIVAAIPEDFAGDICFYDDDRHLIVNGEKVDSKSSSLNQFLYDLHDAGLVISVDTSAIHFREGIEKPALGIYASFTAESRTSGYRFTRSVNISSPCTVQPCFINFRQCSVGKKGDKYAPCLGRDNATFIQQLKEHLWNYLNDGDFAWPAMSRPTATV